MDWQQRSLQWLQRPQSIGLLAGLIAIVGLVAYQTNFFSPAEPQMCELISKCNLRHGDLQRIQIALGESGLNDFQIEGRKLLVPRQQHSQYLQAVSERDALPIDLREPSTDSISNPLLSRSQQQALKWQQKKRQLNEMILRLPFVQQAWLEIDVAPSSSPFRPARQSAVISIQPEGDRPLDVRHVDTLRRMVGGAVAGLQPEQIEVIDLGEGFAYDRAGDSSAGFNQNSMQQLRAREQQLKDQIAAALSRFKGVDVDVRLSACPASISQPVRPVVATERAIEPRPIKPASPLSAGSNGVASIYDEQPAAISQPNGLGVPGVPGVPAIQISHVENHSQHADAIEDRAHAGAACRVAVQIAVPESALANVAMSLTLRRPGLSSGDQKVDRVEQKFSTIRPQIEREVASMLPSNWIGASGSSPIEVTLKRSATTPVVASGQQISRLLEKYWPTAAALCVGVVLLLMVIRKPNYDQQVDAGGAEILSMAGRQDLNLDAAKSVKESINRMFREDPDNAATAIEGWIRKAG